MALSLVLGGGAAKAQAPTVVHLTLDGVVDPFEASYLRSGIASAGSDGAAAVLLTIDTPGGLDSSMRQIIQAIVNSEVPVICYVSPSGARAASAGTFIMESCPVAAMSPGTEIGAAHPVGVAGAIEEQKVTNDAVAYIQSLAHLRGRNEDWVAQAVRDSVSVPADQALGLHVIDLVEPSTDALLRAVDGRTVKVGGGAQAVLHTAGAMIETRNLGLGASLLHALLSPDFAFIFFYLGIGLIVFEIFHPGVVVPAILGILSLVAALVAFGALPVQLIGVGLLLASVVFFLLELKHPGIGAFTVGGVITLVLGGLTLFDPSVPNAHVSPWVIGVVAIVIVAFFSTVIASAVATRRMPKVPPAGQLVGATGVVTKSLRPSGVVLVGSEHWSARVDGGSVPRGTRVRVVAVDGLRLTVRPIDEKAPVGPGQGGR